MHVSTTSLQISPITLTSSFKCLEIGWQKGASIHFHSIRKGDKVHGNLAAYIYIGWSSQPQH